MYRSKIHSFQVAGSCHAHDLSQCQDIIFQICDTDLTTIAVCDGAGFSSYARTAATTTAKIICQELHDHFAEYHCIPIPLVRRKITAVLESKLREKADELRIKPSLLATTILAASVDSTGNILALHLGDGTMYWTRKNDENLKELSLPQRGYRRNSTFLTINCPLAKFLRVYRWSQPDIEKIILMTDGMDCLQESVTANLFAFDNREDLNQSMLSCDAYDDLSYAVYHHQ